MRHTSDQMQVLGRSLWTDEVKLSILRAPIDQHCLCGRTVHCARPGPCFASSPVSASPLPAARFLPSWPHSFPPSLQFSSAAPKFVGSFQTQFYSTIPWASCFSFRLRTSCCFLSQSGRGACLKGSGPGEAGIWPVSLEAG